MDDRNKEGFGQIKSKAEEFLQIFRKGEEFTQEILKENEKLRFKIVQLEEENLALKGSDGGKIKSMQEKLAVLEEENRRLMEHYRAAELENKNFAEKYLEVEQENNNLANLYVASYQLHSTLDFNEVLKTVLEIIMNLVGAEKFAIMLLDEKTNQLAAVATEGVSVEEMPQINIGDGIIGKVALIGRQPFLRQRNGIIRPDRPHRMHTPQDKRPRDRCTGYLSPSAAEGGLHGRRLRAVLDAGGTCGYSYFLIEALLAVREEACYNTEFSGTYKRQTCGRVISPYFGGGDGGSEFPGSRRFPDYASAYIVCS